MKKSARGRKLAQVGWLLVGLGAVALLCLLFLPWSMAGAAGLLAPGAHSQFGSGKNSQFKPER